MCVVVLSGMDDADVLFVRNEATTHGSEVRRLELAVDEQAAELFEHTCQMDKGEFRGAGYEREHAFAEKGLAEIHAVETTHQPISTLAAKP